MKLARKASAKIISWFRERIAVKMTVSILLLVLCISTIFSVFGYLVSVKLSTKLEEQFVLRLMTNIQSVTKYLASIPEHADEITGKDNPAYSKIKQQFETFKKEENLENVYVMTKVQNKEQIVILTGLDDDYGTAFLFPPDANEAMNENKQIISHIYTDEYGIHKSVFVPMKNVQGENVGVVGIDLDATVISKTKHEILWTTSIVTIFVLLIGYLTAYFISRSVRKPVIQLMHVTEKVAAGDLSEQVTIQRVDEIGKLGNAFAEMRHNLDSLIRQIVSSSNLITNTSAQLYQSADESSSSAGQVAISMNNMNEGVAEVVASIADSTSLIVDINSELAEVTTEVKEMQEMAHQVGLQSADGQQLVEKTLHQMNVIQKEMKHSQEAAQQLGNRSKEIGEIIHIITEIAQQTNLLALNASIEAARVGEQGERLCRCCRRSEEIGGTINERRKLDHRTSFQYPKR